MTRDELRKELIADDEWVRERMDGLRKKYNKQLRNKRIRENSILGTTHYKTPRGNDVFVCLIKRSPDRKKKYAYIAFASLFSFRDGKKQKFVYPRNNPRTNTYKNAIVFSSHSVDRMKERLGMGITEVFVQHIKMNYGCTAFMDYDYNGRSDELYCDFGPCILLAREHPWGKIVSTIITKDQQHANQKVLGAYSSRCANQLSVIGAQKRMKEFETDTGFYKQILTKQAG